MKVLDTFGDGSDGRLTIKSGEVFEMTKDMQFRSVNLRRGAILVMNNHRLYVSGVLDLRKTPCWIVPSLEAWRNRDIPKKTFFQLQAFEPIGGICETCGVKCKHCGQ